ncbi:MAG TPA: zinc-dependent peptidase, partial [Cytophagaceae bacterium]|nr:zinc-dependent peptidase [Cytophagaceae bacterium]
MTIGALLALMILYYIVTKLFERRSLSGTKQVKLTEPLSSVHKSILSERFNYYSHLSIADKELFEKRVRYYMTSKMFTSENGYGITDEMKVMISASASQITLGLPAVANSNYTHILIMPNAAMTPRSTSRNTIVIPWREFLDGYKHSDDGQNEGLKIMGAGLVRDNRLQDKAYKIFPAKKYQNW